MKITIIIVSWNVKELLQKCLKSIFDYTKDVNFEVYVVDNNSSDDTVDMVEKNFPQVKLIANDYNAGFAKANNQPFAKSVGEEVLFMNPDMEFTENSIKIMHEFLNRHPKTDIATCGLKYPDSERQYNIKRLPSFLSQLLILLKLHHLFYFLPTLQRYLAKDFNYNTESEVENIMGAFVYARTEKFIEIGKWNEDYWLWWEDVDLCKKAKDCGLTIMYTPDTSVIHHEGKSFAQVASVPKQKRFIIGMLTYFKKHHPYWQYLVLKALSPISVGLAQISQLLKIKPRPQSRV